jgi:hypothetical protein
MALNFDRLRHSAFTLFTAGVYRSQGPREESPSAEGLTSMTVLAQH